MGTVIWRMQLEHSTSAWYNIGRVPVSIGSAPNQLHFDGGSDFLQTEDQYKFPFRSTLVSGREYEKGLPRMRRDNPWMNFFQEKGNLPG